MRGLLFGKHSGGSLLLPRKVARAGALNWPKCAICCRAVDAYGIENETDASIEIWARCTGIRVDPDSGQAVHGSFKRHETKQSSTVIFKGIGWSRHRFTDIVSRLTFFDPQGERRFRQSFSAESAEAVPR